MSIAGIFPEDKMGQEPLFFGEDGMECCWNQAQGKEDIEKIRPAMERS